MVIPPVIARYLTQKFQTLLVVSPILGAFCGAAGMYLSFYLDISSAATIVLTSAAIFMFVEIAVRQRPAGSRIVTPEAGRVQADHR
jgi:manganese/iron transport system permease protein/iron/zinc/copper transport system permease protein